MNFHNMFTRQEKSSHAWAISLIMHVVLLFAIGLLWTQQTPQGISETTSDKLIGIVIASTTSPSNQTQYFDESSYKAKTSTSEDTNAETKSLTLEQPLSLPDIDLPGLDSLISNTAVTPVGSALNGGKLADGMPTIGPSAEQIAKAQRKLPREVNRGPLAEISIFGGSPAAGHDFVFVIDRSKSMGGQGLNALVAAQQQITQALVGLSDNHHFNIIAYHHRPTYFQAGNAMVSPNKSNINLVNKFFDGLAAFGGTDHEMGIIAALRYKPDVIFFLTDGGDPYLNQAQISGLKKYCGERTSIYSVQFGFGPLQEKQNFMTRLAQETSGDFHYVDMRAK